jgi:hypothetical protein
VQQQIPHGSCAGDVARKIERGRMLGEPAFPVSVFGGVVSQQIGKGNAGIHEFSCDGAARHLVRPSA